MHRTMLRSKRSANGSGARDGGQRFCWGIFRKAVRAVFALHIVNMPRRQGAQGSIDELATLGLDRPASVATES